MPFPPASSFAGIFLNPPHPDSGCYVGLQSKFGLIRSYDVAGEFLVDLNDSSRVEAKTGQLRSFISLDSNDFSPIQSR